MFKKVLVAYDGSEHSQRAAQIAGDLGRMQSKAEIWLVCVQSMIPYGRGDSVIYINKLIDEQTREGKILLRAAKKLIGDKLTIHEELLIGTPAEMILEIAETNKCDLIVMGTRGLSGLRGLLLGSQIQKVIRHADCPVLAVK